MAKSFRAVAVTLALVLVTVSALFLAPRASAAARTWTTDTDFNAAGSIFTSTEVIGTGTPAEVNLIRSTIDWANMNPGPPTPGNLEGPAMVFDDAGDVTVLFGGYYGSGYSQKTWEFNYLANTWTEITTTPKPPARQSAGMSYDPAQGVIVMHGGYDDSGYRSDTWEYTVATNTWSEIIPATGPPPATSDSPLVYYASQAQHLKVGQCSSGPCAGSMVTWAYNAATDTWTQRTIGSPSGRYGISLAYHAALDRAVLHGGASPPATIHDQTWEYNWASNSWSQTGSVTPSARLFSAMTYRASDSTVILFGGATSSGPGQDTYRYTTARVWQPIGTVTHPPGRQSAALTYDTLNSVVLLYGGWDGSGGRFGDTWKLGSAYANGGSYTSAGFDSGGFSQWGELWWNRSETAPLTIRFLIATSNDGVTWSSLHGPAPSCSVSVYYVTPGTPISCSGQNGHTDDGKRYIKFFAQLATSNTQFTPHLEDVTITYAIPPSPPCIVFTDPPSIPAAGAFMNPTWKNITVQFSEAMDAATFLWRVIQGVLNPANFTAAWNADNTVVTLRHPSWLLAEADLYQIQFYGTDPDGFSLSALCPDGSASKDGYSAARPLSFTTAPTFPTIVYTVPALGDTDVSLTDPIIVEFSEGMDTTSLLVTFLDGPPVTFTHQWAAGDTVVSLVHTDPLAGCDRYEVQVNASDKAGLDLIPGLRPNPWFFYTFCENPFIVNQNPIDEQLNVAANAPIVVDFSEPMLRSSVTFTIVPNVTHTLGWSASDTRLTVTHSQAFSQCTVVPFYTVTITGTDLAGNPLVQNPERPDIVNPWRFQAGPCPNPIILRTEPADGDANVTVFRPIVIIFSAQMNTASVIVTVTGGTFTEMSRQWDPPTMPQLLTISHIGFSECARYTVTVSGRSSSGFNLVAGFVPNPWSFEIVCNRPYVLNTNPVAGAQLVGLAREIWVNFSKAMDPLSVIALVNNGAPTFTPTWLNGDTTLRLDHAAPLVDCFEYNITIDGNSADGYPILIGAGVPGAPNPWEFTTRCLGFYIIRTDPPNGATNVPYDKIIEVEFSEPADPLAFQFSLNPPGGLVFTQTWLNGNTLVRLDHTTLFAECVQYTATVSARNPTGDPLINVTGSAANPWQFRAACVSPQILWTSPFDQETGVSVTAAILVKFSEPMNRLSVVAVLTPPAGTLTYTWSESDTNASIAHSSTLAVQTLYTVTVSGRDLQNNVLAPGPVPNPWVFTTGSGPSAPGGLEVVRLPPNDLLITWRTVPGATSYNLYHAISRSSPWPWGVLAPDYSSNAYIHPGALSDGATHCYIVRAKFGPTLESGNSTMGCKVPLSFIFSALRTSVYWISLPYRTIYQRASDISTELGPANQRIDVVGKWDAPTQRTLLWFYFRGRWQGTDFPIGPGDGIFLSARSTFQWAVNGTDRSVPRTFTFSASRANINWMSLPFTGVYGRARDVVLDIEGSTGPGANTRIIEVAKWNGTSQSLQVFRWSASGWTGTDFTLAPGEGIYLTVVSTFTWTPRLITPEVP